MKPINSTNRPAALGCTACPHGMTAAKLATVPEATRLLDEPAPCPYLAALVEAQR